jgi:zinc protease
LRNRASRTLALAAFLSVPCLAAVPRTAPATPVRVDENAWTEKLPDGPTLLLIPQRSVPMFSCTVLVPAGSALENETTSGAAHYLEHLTFNGTATRTREEIYALTDRLGAYNNASTQRERTVFQLLLPSEQWREGLELQSDMILHSVLPESMFEKEKGILLEELAKDRSDPGYEAERFASRALWGESSRALPVLGTEESIRNMDPAAVATYYHEHYRPNGLMILLMGDFDVTEARDEVARLYGSGAPAGSIPPRPPFPAGRTVRAASFDQSPSVRVQIELPMPPPAPREFAGVSVLENLLNGGEASAVANAFSGSAVTPLSVSASIDVGSPWALLSIGVELPADALDAKGVTPASVTGAVLDHLAGLVQPQAGWGAIGKRAGGKGNLDRTLAGDFAAARREVLTGEIALREKMHYYGLMRADVLGEAGPEAALRIPEHLDDAGDVALRLLYLALEDGRLLVTVTGPGVESGDTEAPPAPKLPAKTPAAPPAPADRDARPAATVTASSVTRTVLPNGFTLITHASPDSRTFAAHLLFEGRAALEAADGVARGTSDVVHRMMGQGTKGSGEAELRGRLARLGATLKVTDSPWIPYDDYYFSPEYSYVRLETIDTYALAALDLLAEVVTTPRFTNEALQQAIGGAVARAKKDEGSTRAAASAAFYAAGWTGHPLAGGVYGPTDALEALTLDQVRRHHKAMIDPTRLTLVVSTNLTPEAIAKAVRTGFGSLKPAGDAPKLPACTPGAPVRREIEMGSEQAWIVVGKPLVGVPDEDAPALALAVSILSDRLADQLREREGLAYSIGAGARLESPGPALTLSAGTRPENLPRMEEGLLEVTRGFLDHAPSGDAVTAARNSGEGRRRMRRLSRMGQAYAMAMADLYGHDPAALDAKLPALRAVTPDDVQRVARKWLALDDPTVVIAR